MSDVYITLGIKKLYHSSVQRKSNRTYKPALSSVTQQPTFGRGLPDVFVRRANVVGVAVEVEVPGFKGAGGMVIHCGFNTGKLKQG